MAAEEDHFSPSINFRFDRLVFQIDLLSNIPTAVQNDPAMTSRAMGTVLTESEPTFS